MVRIHLFLIPFLFFRDPNFSADCFLTDSFMTLFSIATDPENLSAINTLAGMGILTGDDNIVDAALSEILALPIEHRHSVDPQRNVDYLLIQHHLAQVSTRHHHWLLFISGRVSFLVVHSAIHLR